MEENTIKPEINTFELKKSKRIRVLELENHFPESIELQVVLDSTNHVKIRAIPKKGLEGRQNIEEL